MSHLPTWRFVFCILVCAAWSSLSLGGEVPAADTIRQAVAVLEAPEDGDSYVKAFRQLSDLGTPEAIHEMVRHFHDLRNPESYNVVQGTLAKPEYLPQALKEMEQLLAEPDFPADAAFLQFLLYYSYEDRTVYMTLGNGSWSDSAIREEIEKFVQTELDLKWAMVQKAYQIWPLKHGKAQTNLIYALYMEMNNAGQYHSSERLPYTSRQLIDMRNRLANELAGRLDQFPLNIQLFLLKEYGKALVRPALLPFLLKLYQTPVIPDKTWHWNHKEQQTLLLNDIQTLAPDKARELLLKDLRNGIAGFNTEALDLLPPDQAPPDMDDIVLRFLTGDDSAMSMALLNRYGSAKLAPHIRELYLPKAGHLTCELEEGYLAYLFRVAPEEAQVAFEKSLKSTDAGCRWSLLSTVVKRAGVTPYLRSQLIAQLHDADLDFAGSAAQTLSEQGDQEAKSALWRRLEELHRELAAHPEKLDSQARGDNPTRRFESTLVQALTLSPHWILDKAEMERLISLCVSLGEKVSVRSMITQSWGGPVPITIRPGANENWPSHDLVAYYGFMRTGFPEYSTKDKWSVAEYDSFTREDMLRKVSQFPQHTVFSFQLEGKIAPEDEQALFDSLQKDLGQRGMTLVQGPKWDPFTPAGSTH